MAVGAGPNTLCVAENTQLESLDHGALTLFVARHLPLVSPLQARFRPAHEISDLRWIHTACMDRSSHSAIAAISARRTMIWSIRNRSASSALTLTR
ncbi:MAG: hypothetical protein RL701_5292 [Pseudomonadota bacterium]